MAENPANDKTPTSCTLFYLVSPWHKLKVTYTKGYDRCETEVEWPTKEVAAVLASLAVGAAALVLVVLTTGDFDKLIGDSTSKAVTKPNGSATLWRIEFFSNPCSP